MQRQVSQGIIQNIEYPNGITDPEYSIEVGTFSDCLKRKQK